MRRMKKLVPAGVIWTAFAAFAVMLKEHWTQKGEMAAWASCWAVAMKEHWTRHAEMAAWASFWAVTLKERWTQNAEKSHGLAQPKRCEE